MDNPFGIISQIAEQRISEAMEAGEFDNLPGAGKPLHLEDTSHIPPELRMAWKVLANAGCLPPQLQERKEIATLDEMLDNCPDEKARLKCMRKLRYLIDKMVMSGHDFKLAAQDEYLQMILARLEKHEREQKGRS